MLSPYSPTLGRRFQAVVAGSYRKTEATCVALRDPCQTLGRVQDPPRILDEKKATGVLALYCDGNHVFADLTYFRGLFQGYENACVWHPGLHLVPRRCFSTPRYVPTDSMSGFWLQHKGFSGKPGERLAKLQFWTGSQLSKPWDFELRRGCIVNLIVDQVDWHLETIWLRKDQNVRRELLKRSRHIPSFH